MPSMVKHVAGSVRVLKWVSVVGKTELAELIVSLQVCLLLSLAGSHAVPKGIDLELPVDEDLFIEGVYRMNLRLDGNKMSRFISIKIFFLIKGGLFVKFDHSLLEVRR